MVQEHPITPPPELMKEWIDAWYNAKVKHENMTEFVATQAARWGADQELKACCEWAATRRRGLDDDLHAARRPTPPSLKEQALKELKDWTDEKHGPGGEVFLCDGLSVSIIRRALESLPD